MRRLLENFIQGSVPEAVFEKNIPKNKKKKNMRIKDNLAFFEKLSRENSKSEIGSKNQGLMDREEGPVDR